MWRIKSNADHHEWALAWSQDGSKLAYLSDVDGSSQIWLMNADGSNQRPITAYPGPGSIAYVTWSPDDETLVVTVAEDVGAWLMTMPVADGTLQEFVSSSASYPTIGPDGTMAYVTWADDDTDVVLADADGRLQDTVSATADPEDVPNFSPDGTKLAFNVGGLGDRHVEFVDLKNGKRSSIPQMGDDSNPVWGPDGAHLACVVNANGAEDIYLVPIDGGDPTKLTIAPHDRVWYLAWTA